MASQSTRCGAAEKLSTTKDGESVLVRCKGGGISRWSLQGIETVLVGPIRDAFRANMIGGLRENPLGFWGDARTFISLTTLTR